MTPNDPTGQPEPVANDRQAERDAVYELMRAALKRMVDTCGRYIEERPLSDWQMYSGEYVCPLKQSESALSRAAELERTVGT